MKNNTVYLVRQEEKKLIQALLIPQLLHIASTPKKKQVVEYVFRLLLQHTKIQPRQKKIAAQLGVSLSIVKEVLSELTGVLFSEHHRFLNNKRLTNLYVIKHDFNQVAILKSIAKHFRFLQIMVGLWLGVTGLFSAPTLKRTFDNEKLILTSINHGSSQGLYLKTTEQNNRVNSLTTKKIVMPKKEHSHMKQPIPEYLLAIRSFKPTEQGYVDLAIIPQAVVVWADKEMLTKKPENPFKYFMSISRKRCSELGLLFDLDLKKRLMKERDYTEGAILYDPTFVPVKAQQETATRGKAKSSSTVSGYVPNSYRAFAEKKEQEAEEKRIKHEIGEQLDLADPYSAALKIEKALHNPEFKRGIKQLWQAQKYNPWFTQLNGIEQRRLLGQVHNDCDCDKSFLSKLTDIAITLEQAKQTMLVV